VNGRRPSSLPTAAAANQRPHPLLANLRLWAWQAPSRYMYSTTVRLAQVDIIHAPSFSSSTVAFFILRYSFQSFTASFALFLSLCLALSFSLFFPVSFVPNLCLFLLLLLLLLPSFSLSPPCNYRWSSAFCWPRRVPLPATKTPEEGA